ncbi:MAG: hypothetical protein AMXMBFR84_45750 [Candidatus Hydrogenedentota bacterium]
MPSLQQRLQSDLARSLPAHPGVRCVLVEVAGIRQAEFRVADSPSHERFPLRSVTKSVLVTLLGIAWDDGTLGSLEFPFADAFPEYCGMDTPMYLHGTTTEHVLAMTAGFDWPVRYPFRETQLHTFLAATDWLSFAVNLPIRRERIGRFGYCSPASHLLSAFLQRATGLDVDNFARVRLFEPLGITDWEWDHDPQGIALGGWGLQLSADSLCAIGRLYVQSGVWEKQSLLSSEWIRRSTRPHTPHYGFHWWIRDVHGHRTVFAAGTGGQYLILVPELEAVVAILSQPGQEGANDPWPVFERAVLPSLLES